MIWYFNFARKNDSLSHLIFHWLQNDSLSHSFSIDKPSFLSEASHYLIHFPMYFYQIFYHEPWGTPSFTAAHKEHFPFKTTLWSLFEKKSSMIFSKFADIPFCFRFNITARFCQTLLICHGKHLLLPTHHQRIYRSHGWLIRAG